MSLRRRESNSHYQGVENPHDRSYPPAGFNSGGASKGGRATWKWIAGGIVLIAIIAGAVVGGVVGSNAAKKGNNNAVSGSSAGGSSGTKSATGEASSPTVSVKAIPVWNFNTDKMVGMNVGNWLVLERWMDEDWFTSTSSQTAWDEWDFSEQLGDKALSALQTHWNTWFTEDDMEKLYQAGINHVRLPVAFWHLIPTQGDEPYVSANQMDYVMNATMWAWKRGMYIMFDLHALPGTQNGEQQSGHNTTDIQFYNSTNQDRADAFVAASLQWIAKNPYRSAISSVAAANEPRPWGESHAQILRGYYERTYAALQKSAYPLPMIFHHGFANTWTQPPQSGVAYWAEWASGYVTNPPSLIIEDHPYPGNFPPQTNRADILNQVCNDAKGYIGYPIPVAITEWSLYTGIPDADFMNTFYAAQAVAWAWSCGGNYWAQKVIPTQAQLAAKINYTAYSFLTLLDAGIVPIPQAGGTSGWAFLDQLGNATCGQVPRAGTNNYPQGTTSSWAAGASETNKQRRSVAFSG